MPDQLRKKILVIDDEEDFLMLTKLNLEATGRYTVLTLSSATGIIAGVHSFQPDLILLDFLMPALNGLEACALLNNDPAGQNIPIIVLSALDKDDDKRKAYKQGVVDYLVKPIEKDDLIEKIEKALRFK